MEFRKINSRKKPNNKRGMVVMVIILLLLIYLWFNLDGILENIFPK